MAERRMFAKTIIDSDAFLDMPLSAQSLYFHLSMRADDEGFINNPKKIMRMIGASQDDMSILIMRKFIIPFDSGVVVIKHWRIHNYIRADRLVETNYKDEKAMLIVKENGAYTLDNEIKEIEALDSKDKRKIAYAESSLPYSFSYKIKRAFDGKKCPVCGITMNASNSLTKPTIQHNIPISYGGEHEIDNISVICESCNSSIKNKETPPLNNLEVIDTWDKIIRAEKQKIDWFSNPKVLDNVRQMSDTCPSDVSQMSAQVRLGKDRLGKDSKKEAQTRFSPPSVEEVRAYCESRKNNIDPESFINFYESKGWMVGKTKMKDWKASVRTWERRYAENHPVIPMPEYPEYTDEDVSIDEIKIMQEKMHE